MRVDSDFSGSFQLVLFCYSKPHTMVGDNFSKMVRVPALYGSNRFMDNRAPIPTSDIDKKDTHTFGSVLITFVLNGMENVRVALFSHQSLSLSAVPYQS